MYVVTKRAKEKVTFTHVLRVEVTFFISFIVRR